MPLIIEDGSGVANANSYGNIVDARAYAAARGITLSATDGDVEAQMILAMDYLEAKDYLGEQVSFTQPLSWPRKGLFYDVDTPVPQTTIPPNLINAQYQLVIEQFNGVDLQPTWNSGDDKGFVIEDKTDVLDTKYSDKIGTTSEPVMPKVVALLRGLVLVTSVLRTVRV